MYPSLSSFVTVVEQRLSFCVMLFNVLNVYSDAAVGLFNAVNMYRF